MILVFIFVHVWTVKLDDSKGFLAEEMVECKVIKDASMTLIISLYQRIRIRNKALVKWQTLENRFIQAITLQYSWQKWKSLHFNILVFWC